MECYGLNWPDGTEPALIERYMIRNGGQWQKNGETIGQGLEFHFKEYWKLLWPEDSQTWWTDLLIKEVLQNQFTSLVGPASSWKTGTICRIALMDWSVFPECTTVLMSSTDMESLKAKIYGETSKMWNMAHERHDWFPGNPIDHKCVIANQSIEEDKARDIRDGIIGVPCKTSTGRFLGMAKYSGRKNRRVWCIGDEFQHMELSILDAQDNLVSNGSNLVPGIIEEGFERGMPKRGYKCVFISNTNPSRPGNPADVVSEPEHGWGSVPEDNKTKVWKCKKLHNHPVQCRCVNLDAMDSPNSGAPLDKPPFPHLAGPHKLAIYTEGSESYWSQGRGAFRFGLAEFKIITMELCQQHRAFDPLIWSGKGTTRIGMLDAAYGSGDRCALGWLEFGECVDLVVRCLFHPWMQVPITIRKDMTPEQQIATYCKDKMEEAEVPPENFFFDGRGSLAVSLAMVWSPRVNAVEFGGTPTDRPVNSDEYVIDKVTGNRRLKLAKEHYVNFVTELWWSWHYAIVADQVRGLTEDIVLDAQPREWSKIANDKMQVETKKILKGRTGISCDLADMAAVGIEGARRRGFTIGKLSNTEEEYKNMDFLDNLRTKSRTLRKAHSLSYS